MDSILWNALAATLIVPALQGIKRWLHLGGAAMRGLTVVIALIVGAIWSIKTHDGCLVEMIKNPEMFLVGSGSILGLASLIYGIVKDKMGLSNDYLEEED